MRKSITRVKEAATLSASDKEKLIVFLLKMKGFPPDIARDIAYAAVNTFSI